MCVRLWHVEWCHAVIVKPSGTYLRFKVSVSVELWWKSVSDGDWLVSGTSNLARELSSGCSSTQKGGLWWKMLQNSCCYIFIYFRLGGVQEGLGEYQRSQHQFLWDATVSKCCQSCSVYKWCKFEIFLLQCVEQTNEIMLRYFVFITKLKNMWVFFVSNLATKLNSHIHPEKNDLLR